jgi:hypothetical protein
VEEYQRFSATLAVGDASRRRLFFERQVADARENLARAEEEMKQTEQRTGVIELDGQAHAMIASAAMLRAQVAAKQVEIQAMRQFAADGNPDLERAQQELSGLEGQLAAMDVAKDRSSGDLVAPTGLCARLARGEVSRGSGEPVDAPLRDGAGGRGAKGFPGAGCGYGRCSGSPHFAVQDLDCVGGDVTGFADGPADRTWN